MDLNKPIRNYNEWLSPKEYAVILSTAEKNISCRLPPVKPKPGDIILYHNNEAGEDWKSDQFRWRNNGTKALPQNNPVVMCTYYFCTDEPKFQKRAFVLLEDTPNNATVVIHYVGSCEVPQRNKPHGNCKVREIPHVMTAKSQIKAQKSNLKVKSKVRYRQLTSSNVEQPLLTPVLEPKSSKQVSNTLYRERVKYEISNDDILGLYVLNEELGGFVKTLCLLPNFVTVLCSDRTLKITTHVFSCNVRPIMYYDTTFNLGDFYVSTLVYSNPLFESNPTVPLAYCLHDRKSTEVHCTCFQRIASLFPGIHGSIIVTDREDAIRKAISTVLPRAVNVTCWNHIQQDVKHWVKKQKDSESGDIKVYCNNVWDLMDSNSYEEFNDKYLQMSQVWSDAFRTYFDEYLIDDLIDTGKWKLTDLGIYKERSGITINASESMNAVLKRLTDRKEMKCQTLALTLYQLDLFYQKEILRGLCGIGDYLLEEDYAPKFKLNFEEVDFPKGVISFEKIPYVFENREFNINEKRNEEEPHSLFGVAKMIVLQGRVKHVPEEQAFIVSNAEKKHVVTIYPNQTCSCNAKRHCVHILAVRLSLGDFQKPTAKIKLNKLMRRKRGFRSGRKTAPKKVKDITCADDSAFAISNDEMNYDTMAIPTVSPGSKIVKERFVSTPVTKKRRSIKGVDTTLEEEDDGSHLLLKKLKTQGPAACSTPIKDEFKTNNVEKISHKNDSESLRSLITDTFQEKFKKDKQFVILGLQIYPSNLDCLITNSSNYTDHYLSESVIAVYMKIMENNLEAKPNVRIFTCDVLLSFTTNIELLLSYSLRQFVMYDIPKNDIVLIPAVQSNHCTLYVILMKCKTIIYLDSLHGNPKPEHLNIFCTLLKRYSEYMSEDFTDCFTVYAPKDIPYQKNMIDCGLYVCLFTEVITKKSTDPVRLYHESGEMKSYRLEIYQKIADFMEKYPYSQSKEKRIKRNKIKHLNLKETETADYKLFTTCPGEDCTTVEYLSRIIDNY